MSECIRISLQRFDALRSRAAATSETLRELLT